MTIKKGSTLKISKRIKPHRIEDLDTIVTEDSLDLFIGEIISISGVYYHIEEVKKVYEVLVSEVIPMYEL
ncbi:hypothetical protein [Paenibacillus elgii]|uniref:hypothetical protein n=1 Tax=Paenibacillus elgii TaxID=189691 RepID=UPI00204101AC|nr:hypothetical protein [Paenibacillus elgii]MCM3271142.1 hypothetical protein [Paenibacillus elgii]